MKCEKCGKKIEYNQYRIYVPKADVLCLDCYKKTIAEKQAEIDAKRAARKVKRGKRKKYTRSNAESYNPFVGEK